MLSASSGGAVRTAAFGSAARCRRWAPRHINLGQAAPFVHPGPRTAPPATRSTLACPATLQSLPRACLVSLAGLVPALWAGSAQAMQELANELSEMELGLEPMPDASLLTVATLIYCSLAAFGVFLRQQDEELEDPNKSQSGTNRQDKAASTSDAATDATRSQTSSAASTSGRPQDGSGSSGGTSSGASLAAAQKYCQQLSRDSRLRVLCSNAAGHVTTSVRDSKYLLEQIMPLRLRDICNGAAPAPPSSTSSGSAIAAPGGLPPAPLDQDSSHGRNESALRTWLADLVDAQVDAKQRSTGLSRETAARVVLNNQDATLRHLCTIVAQETAMLGVLQLMATLQADPAFNPALAPVATEGAGRKAAAH